LSNYVFTDSITILWLYIHNIMHLNRESKCGRCPHPASGINIDFVGNNYSADGINVPGV